MKTAEALAPLRERNFAWYYASRISDTLGSMMAGVALAFAVLEATDSATALGQVLAAHTIPLVLFLLFGGVIADRFPRTLVLQSSNIVSALSQGTLAWLVITDQADLWMFITLAAVNGTADSLSFPAMASMVPQLVDRTHLQNANALISLSRGGLTIAGPAVSGVLVATVGPGYALAVNAAMWVVSTVLLLPVKIPPRPPKEEETSTFQELREGWQLFIGTTWLWVIVLAFGILNAIHAGAWFTLGPALADRTIGARGWGLVLSAESAGLVVMTLVLLRFRLRRPLLLGMLGCTLMGAPMVMLGLVPDQLLALVLVTFVAGAGIEVFSLGWNLAMQEHIDEDKLSRAYSYDALGSFVAMPVGQLVYGPLGDAFGFRDVLVVSGVLYTVVCLLALTSSSVRRLDRVPEPAAEPVTPA